MAPRIRLGTHAPEIRSAHHGAGQTASPSGRHNVRCMTNLVGEAAPSHGLKSMDGNRPEAT